MKERILDINPQATVTGIQEFYSIENALKILTGNYDFLVDAIDVISPKIDLIVNCKKASIPMISAMGAGNKLDPTKFNVADISRTSVCPLARKIRKELRRRGIYNGVKVVFSTEIHSNKKRKNNALLNKNSKQVFYRNPIGSISFVPSVMGLIIAGEVVRDLLEIDHTKTI